MVPAKVKMSFMSFVKGYFCLYIQCCKMFIQPVSIWKIDSPV